MAYLSKLKEEHKKLIPYITEFFSELLSKEYSKMAATMEFPIPEEDDIPEELESIVGKVKGPLSYFDENIKCSYLFIKLGILWMTSSRIVTIQIMTLKD